MFGVCRVIVGTSGSPGSLPALRYAESFARVCDAILIPVLAWTPPGGDIADRLSPCGYLCRLWAEDARQRLSEALLRATESPGRRSPPDGEQHLTGRELTVARMAAAGHSNRAIAQHLFISEKTVEYHLGKVFALTPVH